MSNAIDTLDEFRDSIDELDRMLYSTFGEKYTVGFLQGIIIGLHASHPELRSQLEKAINNKKDGIRRRRAIEAAAVAGE